MGVRLLIGAVVLTCAEVFSGASLGKGLWHPFTLIVTYWLYFAHFFFLTTLAVRTGRTSLGAPYLWGVLFGLYESWITKVIWYGYSNDGKFVMGSIGPYGFSEISMVFFFHPVVSLILPLAVACLLFPSLRQVFPQLAWLTGRSRGARLLQGYVVLSFVPIMAMNSRGPMNFAINAAFVLAVLWVLIRLARPGSAAADERSIVTFGRRGFTGLCLYLAVLYGAGYVVLLPEGLPSVAVQAYTLVFYAIAIVGLVCYLRREPLPADAVVVDPRELRVVRNLFALMLVLALALSPLAGRPIWLIPILPNFAVWTPLGFLLTLVAFVAGVRERVASGPSAPSPKS